MRDEREGGEYTVYDPALGGLRNRRCTSIAGRIARVDGQWLCVSPVPFFAKKSWAQMDGRGPGEMEQTVTVAVTPEGWGFVHREPTGSFYLDFLRDVMGIDGPYRSGVRFVSSRAGALASCSAARVSWAAASWPCQGVA